MDSRIAELRNGGSAELAAPFAPFTTNLTQVYDPAGTTVIDGINLTNFREITAGGESDNLAPDPKDPNILYGGRVEKLDLRTMQTLHHTSGQFTFGLKSNRPRNTRLQAALTIFGLATAGRVTAGGGCILQEWSGSKLVGLTVRYAVTSSGPARMP